MSKPKSRQYILLAHKQTPTEAHGKCAKRVVCGANAALLLFAALAPQQQTHTLRHSLGVLFA